MTFEFRGIPTREINGLPYAVHQSGQDGWQVVIQNCARHPAGYTFAPVYSSYEEAMQALDSRLRSRDESDRLSGDDTSAAYLARFED